MGTSLANSYIAITDEAISDTNSIQIESIDEAQALQAMSYTSDTTAPALRDYTLNMNTEYIAPNRYQIWRVRSSGRAQNIYDMHFSIT